MSHAADTHYLAHKLAEAGPDATVTLTVAQLGDILDALNGSLDMHDEAVLRADLAALVTGEER